MPEKNRKAGKFPPLKVNLVKFLTSEEGKISKTKISHMAGASIGVGLGLAALLMSVKSTEAACSHSSHGSHSSHASHSSHSSHASHASHSSHSSHGSHSSHASHGSHGSY